MAEADPAIAFFLETAVELFASVFDKSRSGRRGSLAKNRSTAPGAQPMSISAKGKLAYVALVDSVLIVLLIWKNGIAGEMIRTTESPQGRYRVEVAKRRFLTEDAVYLNAYRGKNRLVGRKLLFTGDFLDQDFQDLYPTYFWISENTLQIGQRSVFGPPG